MSTLAKVTPVSGARSFFAGARFVVLRPRSWRLAIVPVLVAAVVVGATGAAGVWGAIALAGHLTAGLHGALGSVATVLLDVLLGVVAVLLAVLVGLSLAQPLSGPALEALSQEFEGELGGPTRTGGDFWPSFWRSLRVTFAALAVGMPLLAVLAVVDLVLPVAVVVTMPLKFVVTALMVAWDLLDYPFSLREMRVRARLAWMRANFGATLGFGALGALGLMIPVLGLLVLPVGVAGATHLVTSRERADSA